MIKSKKQVFKPNPPVGKLVCESLFYSKRKEQKLNDALYLKGLASHLEESYDLTSHTAFKLREIADRLNRKK